MLTQLILLVASAFFITNSNAVPDHGPGFSSPESAIKNHKREEILYIPAISVNQSNPDYLMVIDVNPQSHTYSQVIHRVYMPEGQPHCELHICGWNVCSSCHHDKTVKRNKLICPCFGSDAIWIVDTTNERCPKHYKYIPPKTLHDLGLSTPHTPHCLPNGQIMIGTLGDGPDGNAKGSFVLLDSKNDFKVCGKWTNDEAQYNLDFWYQSYFDVLVSTQLGAPNKFKCGLHTAELPDYYGHSLNFWSWKKKKLIQTIDLGAKYGTLPLEVKFVHDPYKPHGYVACAYSSTVHHITRDASGKWIANRVITIPPKSVENWWVGPTEMRGYGTIIIISMDDKYLYLSNWVHGDIRQYDISKPDKPKLVGQVFVGGSIVKGGAVTVVKDTELDEQPEPLCIKDTNVQGGPEMLQLSLDGKRLYTTTSLFTGWDRQYYPEMMKRGSSLVAIDVDTKNGGMKINRNFIVDFGDEPRGPVLAHDIHYPGGDCTSDIFVPEKNYRGEPIHSH